MDFFKVISENEFKEIVKSNLTSEVVSFHKESLINSLGKILACDVKSPSILPLYDRSTVDGYAVVANDVFCASSSIPAFLNVVGTIAIGEMPKTSIKKGECVYVATGALIPDGATGVVMIENTEMLKDQIAVYSPIRPYENIVKKSEEIKVDDIIAKKGEVVTPLLIGVLSSIGVKEVDIFNDINIGIISTGDELAFDDEEPINGKIRDINTNLLSSFVIDYGYKISYINQVRDDKIALENALIEATNVSDIVIMSGGSSVGAKDFTKDAFEKLGKLLVHGVALKPGKPTVLGSINSKLIYGLPGNPLAAILVLKTLLLDVINETRGKENKPLKYAKALSNFHSTPGRLTLQPVSVLYHDGEVVFEPVFLKSAHIAGMLKADGYVRVSPDSEGVNVGDNIAVFGFYNA